jgi:hypothetical protein
MSWWLQVPKERPEKKTVHALLDSASDTEVEQGMVFLRRVFALLVIQYSAVLMIASPFAFIEVFKDIIHPYHTIMEMVGIAGIIASLVLAVTRGAIYPFATVAIISLTLSVGLELGLSFANASWGRYGLMAVGQATTSFAIILSILQFPTKSLVWFTYPAAAIVSLLLASLWMVVLFETGLSLKTATFIGLGGWAFCVINVLCVPPVSHQVTRHEYILATLFILCPEALPFLATNKRHPKEDETEAPPTGTDHGGVGSE